MNNIYRTVMSTLFTLAGAFSLLVCPGTAYAVDKAGKADAEEASAQKINSYVELHNTIGRDPAHSYIYMFGDRPEFVVDKANFHYSGINTGAIERRCEAMDDALQFADQAPAMPIDASVKELGPALKELMDACKEAARYYDDTEYVDDYFAKGEELHRRVIAALTVFRPLMADFADKLTAMEKTRRQERLEQMRATDAIIRTAMVEAIYAGQDMVAELARQGITSDTVLELQLDGFMPYYEQLRAAMESMEKAMQDPEQLRKEGLPPPPGAKFLLDDVRKLKNCAAGVIDRVRNGRAVSMGERMNAVNPKNTPEGVVKWTNVLINRYNNM